MIKRISYALLAMGLSAAAAMVLWQGADIVGASMAMVGWWFLPVVAWYGLSIVLMAWSWSLLFPPGRGLPWAQLAYINYIGASINALLPVAAVGGEMVKAVMAISRGVSGAVAGASVVADKAAQTVAQLAFGLIGIGALAYLRPGADMIAGLLGATLFFCVLLAVYFWAQSRGGFSRLARRVEGITRGRLWWDLVGGAEQLDRALDQIYRHHGRVAAACWLRLVVRSLTVVETWLIAQLMGYPIGWVEALMIESLTQTVRGMAFVVPSGIGAQEGAFILLASAAGLPPEIALAISLVKRGREICANAPGLMIMQWGRRDNAGSTRGEERGIDAAGTIRERSAPF